MSRDRKYWAKKHWFVKEMERRFYMEESYGELVLINGITIPLDKQDFNDAKDDLVMDRGIIYLSGEGSHIPVKSVLYLKKWKK